ncbi:MAG: hypothetical protein ABSA47_16170 [Verrucomicrobiota bacterium]
MKITILSILLVMIAASCSTTPKDESGKPVVHANRVKIVMYDSKERTRSTSTEVFDLSRGGKAPIRPYKVIALLTCEGTVNEETDMLNAIIYRARQLGADGLVIRPPARTFGLLWTDLGERRLFSGQAIVWLDAGN